MEMCCICDCVGVAMRRYIFLLMLVLVIALVAACNLETTGSMTPTPLPTPTYAAPTPYLAPTLGPSNQVFGAQGVVITPTTSNVLTPVPAQTLIAQPAPPPTTQNAIEAFINNLIVPVWNFFYTFFLEGAATLWVFAGARGGIFAQFFCCIVPFFVVVIVALMRLRIVRWRR